MLLDSPVAAATSETFWRFFAKSTRMLFLMLYLLFLIL
nr:MAG TPA: hypothetical protein [Caudoviricetes sp.]